MAPTHQSTNYSSLYSNQSNHWSNDWSYQSTSNASTDQLSNFWPSYDSDYWPTFQPGFQSAATNPYFSSDLSMSLPTLGSQQSLPDFIALMRQQAEFEQEVEEEQGFVEGVVDTDQLREELTFLARRKERQDLLVKQDERKKGVVTEEEREKKRADVEAMREEEKEWLASSSFQLPMFTPVDLGGQPWLSDNYLNSRLFFLLIDDTLKRETNQGIIAQ